MAAEGDIAIKEGIVEKIEGPSVWVKFLGDAEALKPARRVPQYCLQHLKRFLKTEDQRQVIDTILQSFKS